MTYSRARFLSFHQYTQGQPQYPRQVPKVLSLHMKVPHPFLSTAKASGVFSTRKPSFRKHQPKPPSKPPNAARPATRGPLPSSRSVLLDGPGGPVSTGRSDWSPDTGWMRKGFMTCGNMWQHVATSGNWKRNLTLDGFWCLAWHGPRAAPLAA